MKLWQALRRPAQLHSSTHRDSTPSSPTAPSPGDDPPPSNNGPAYRVLRHHDYRLLWGAELVSTLGTQMQRVAIAWHVFQLTGDPFQLGLLGLFRFAPVFLFGLIGGVIADQKDRRRTLIGTQVILLITSALLAFLTASDAVTMPIIYAITFFSYAVSAFSGPTRQALIPALVPRHELSGAMALNILASQTAAVSGPAIGGLVIAQFGLSITYAVDALSFLAVIIAVLLMRSRPQVTPLTVRGLSAAIEGLRFLRRSPILLGVMAVDFLATFFGAILVLMPIFAEEILGVGAGGLGLLLAAPAAGAVAGSVVMSAAPLPRRPGAGVLIAITIYGLCIAGFGLSTTMWLSLTLLAVSGAADAISMAFRHTIRNLVTPDELRGRIAAAHSTFAMGGPQLGDFRGGAVAAVIGAGPSVILGGLGTLLTVAIVAKLAPQIGAYRLQLPSSPPPLSPPERSATPSAPAAPSETQQPRPR